MKLAILFLVSVLFISGCAQQTQLTEYTDPTGVYSMSYASGWVDDSLAKTKTIKLLEQSFPGVPSTGSFLKKSKSIFSIYVLKMNFTPDVQETDKMLEDSLSGGKENSQALAKAGNYLYKVLDSGKTEVPYSKTAAYILAEITDSYKEKSTSAVKGNYFIVTQYLSPLMEYDQKTAEVDKMLSSFKLLK